MTCRRCGTIKQKGNREVEVTVKERDTEREISFYLCDFCWGDINDYVFRGKEMIE